MSFTAHRRNAIDGLLRNQSRPRERNPRLSALAIARPLPGLDPSAIAGMYRFRFLEARSGRLAQPLVERIADRDFAGPSMCQERGGHVDRVADGAHVGAAEGALGHD